MIEVESGRGESEEKTKTLKFPLFTETDSIQFKIDFRYSIYRCIISAAAIGMANKKNWIELDQFTETYDAWKVGGFVCVYRSLLYLPGID